MTASDSGPRRTLCTAKPLLDPVRRDVFRTALSGPVAHPSSAKSGCIPSNAAPSSTRANVLSSPVVASMLEGRSRARRPEDWGFARGARCRQPKDHLSLLSD